MDGVFLISLHDVEAILTVVYTTVGILHIDIEYTFTAFYETL